MLQVTDALARRSEAGWLTEFTLIVVRGCSDVVWHEQVEWVISLNVMRERRKRGRYIMDVS